MFHISKEPIDFWLCGCLLCFLRQFSYGIYYEKATDTLKWAKNRFSEITKKNVGFQDELSEKSLLAAKKDELDAASKQWKARVEKSDAEKFSVAGKMGEKIKDAIPSINLPPPDRVKTTPQAKRYKGKDGECISRKAFNPSGLFDKFNNTVSSRWLSRIAKWKYCFGFQC